MFVVTHIKISVTGPKLVHSALLVMVALANKQGVLIIGEIRIRRQIRDVNYK